MGGKPSDDANVSSLVALLKRFRCPSPELAFIIDTCLLSTFPPYQGDSIA